VRIPLWENSQCCGWSSDTALAVGTSVLLARQCNTAILLGSETLPRSTCGCTEDPATTFRRIMPVKRTWRRTTRPSGPVPAIQVRPQTYFKVGHKLLEQGISHEREPCPLPGRRFLQCCAAHCFIYEPRWCGCVPSQRCVASCPKRQKRSSAWQQCRAHRRFSVNGALLPASMYACLPACLPAY
jgi:hypothetical protein